MAVASGAVRPALSPTKHALRTALPRRWLPRQLHTAAPLALSSPSPFVRSIGPRAPQLSRADDFILHPAFLDHEAQAHMIRLALWKLDRVDTRKKRRRRKPVEGATSGQAQQAVPENLQQLFEKEEEYGFEEGHFDSVIVNFRESLLTAFPTPGSLPIISPFYPSILSRIYALLPSDPAADLTQSIWDTSVSAPDPTAPFAPPLRTTAHALHLASNGWIAPHVDNVEASGSVILGVSLGAERIMRLEREGEGGETEGWEVLLPSGSVYVQRDAVRYEYKHSILPYAESEWEGRKLAPGQRISLMLRNSVEAGRAGGIDAVV